ncbi:UNVERIFIED_CONTAM: hypothetical protein FKN15_012269 [Acipenser sinensis]
MAELRIRLPRFPNPTDSSVEIRHTHEYPCTDLPKENGNIKKTTTKKTVHAGWLKIPSDSVSSYPGFSYGTVHFIITVRHFKSLLKHYHPDRVPSPCCFATKMSSLSMLYHETADTKPGLQREASPDLKRTKSTSTKSTAPAPEHPVRRRVVWEILFRDCNPFVLSLAIPIAG